MSSPQLLEGNLESRSMRQLSDLQGVAETQIRTSGVLGRGAVSSVNIPKGTLTGKHLAVGSITTGSIAAGSITTELLVAGAITAVTIAAAAITTEKLQAGSVTADKIQAGTITADKIVAGSLTAAQIQAGTITGALIEAGTLTATNIAVGTLTGNLIAAATITGDRVVANTITSERIAGATITGGLIASGTVTAGHITISSLSALSANLGTINAGTVTGAILRTAAAGKRVEMTTAGLQAFDAVGGLVLDFKTSDGSLTLAGKVTANAGSTVPATVVTGQLTDAQIAAVAAAKMTGQVVASQVGNAAITAKHFHGSLGPGLVRNSGAEGGSVDGWELVQENGSGAPSNLGAVAVLDAPSGDYVFRIQAGYNGDQCVRFPVVPGRAYTFKVRLKHSNGTGAYYVRTTHYADAAGGRIAFTDHVSGALTSGITAWTLGEYTWVCPAGTFFAAPGIYNWGGSTGTLDFDGVEFAEQIRSVDLADLAVTEAKVAASAISTAKIATDAVTAAQIATNAVGSNEIAAGAVVAGKITAGTIVAADIAAGAITTGKLAALAVTTTELAAGAVTAAKITAATITAAELAVGGASEQLCPNGDFHQNLGEGTMPNGWLKDIGGNVYGMSMYTAGGTMPPTISIDPGYNSAASRAFPVIPGEKYSVRVRAFHDAGAGSCVYFRMLERTGQTPPPGGHVTGSGGPAANSQTDLMGCGAVPAGLTAFDYVYTIPANVHWVSFGAYNWVAGGGGYLRVASVDIRRQVAGVTIKDGAVSADKIIAGAIVAGKIAAEAVSATELAANSVIAGKILAGTIVAGDIAADTITATQIAAGAVTANEILAGTITATQIAASTITTDQIQANTIVAGDIAATTITATQIAANTITAGQIDAGSIRTAVLVANSIDAGMIQAGQISTAKLAAGAVTADKITLSLGGSNRLLNSNFNDGVAGRSTPLTQWAGPFECTTSIVQTGTGYFSGKALQGQSPNGAGASPHIYTPWVQCGMWSKLSAAMTMHAYSSTTRRIGVQFANASFVGLQTQTFDVVASSWYRSKAEAVTVPGGAIYVRFYAQVLFPQVGDDIHWSAAQIEEGEKATGWSLAPEDIPPGSIGTTMITPGAITTDLIEASAINGKTITGATVRTAASGARVQMDTGGIFAVDANGADTFRANAATGGIKFGSRAVATNEILIPNGDLADWTSSGTAVTVQVDGDSLVKVFVEVDLRAPNSGRLLVGLYEPGFGAVLQIMELDGTSATAYHTLRSSPGSKFGTEGIYAGELTLRPSGVGIKTYTIYYYQYDLNLQGGGKIGTRRIHAYTS